MLPTSSRGFEVNHSRMREVAKAMRQDLAMLKSESLHELSNGSKIGGSIGKWDVPADLGIRIDHAHKGMVAALELFIAALEDVVDAVEETAVRYDRTTQGAIDDITRRTRPTISNTQPWD